MFNKKKGFTLIELIIVIAIIGILIAIAVPKFAEATRGAQNRKIESQARAIAGAVNAVTADKNKIDEVTAFTKEYQKVDVVDRAGIKDATEAERYKIIVGKDGIPVIEYKAEKDTNDLKYYGAVAFKEKECTTRLTDDDQKNGLATVYFKF